MDDPERPTEEPFGPDEPNFTGEIPQGAYVDEVFEEPSEDLDEENGGEQADTDANM